MAAAERLFEAGGYNAATIGAIAARSGVAKTTIYRWWPNRAALLVELLLELSARLAPEPAGNIPLQAIRTELRRVTKAADALPGRMLLSLLSRSQSDPNVRNALLDGLFSPRRRATAKIIRQGQAQGVFRKDISPLLAVDIVYGPLFYRRFVRQEPVTGGFPDLVLRHVMEGLAPRPGRKPGRRKAKKGPMRGPRRAAKQGAKRGAKRGPRRREPRR
jgi:AcrR family transcriptional regulator